MSSKRQSESSRDAPSVTESAPSGYSVKEDPVMIDAAVSLVMETAEVFQEQNESSSKLLASEVKVVGWLER